MGLPHFRARKTALLMHPAHAVKAMKKEGRGHEAAGAADVEVCRSELCSGSLELAADLAQRSRRSSDHRGTAVGFGQAFEGDVAAINQKIGRGDEGRVVGSKIDRTRGDLLRLARPIEQVPW